MSGAVPRRSSDRATAEGQTYDAMIGPDTAYRSYGSRGSTDTADGSKRAPRPRRVDAEHLDESAANWSRQIRNLSETLPDARDDSLPSKAKEPFVFYGVPERAGDRGRTGDVQLGKLSGPLWGKGLRWR